MLLVIGMGRVIKQVRLIATDVDGTITIDRGTTALHLEAIKYMRLLEESGVYVVLVSSNALPIVVGLKRYIGLRSPCIGETGAYAFFDDRGVIGLSKLSAREALEDVLERFGEYVVESWQNMFRYHDFALKIRRGYRDRAWEVYGMIRDWVMGRYEYIRVGFSGYAIHLTPVDAGKGRALEYVLGELGIGAEEALAVGDSFMDAELYRVVGTGVAVANADQELKREADIVLTRPSGAGFVELAHMVLEDRLPI